MKPLKVIFKKSIETGYVPSDWKSGLIVPIYKNNGKPTECSSYRPVCLTSVVCRLLESVILKQLVEYIHMNDLISSDQHGFLAGRSTCTNLISCLNDWTNLCNSCTNFDIIYFDFARAFDTVSHRKLLLKLRKLGIGGSILRWLEVFLTGRVQHVRVGKSLSPPEPVLSGIPQGTILGPLLFLLYIDDLGGVLSESTMKLYAGDSKVYRPSPGVSDCLKLAEDLLRIQEWLDEWQLQLNLSKCTVLNVGHSSIQFPYRGQSQMTNGFRSSYKNACSAVVANPNMWRIV